ncbi:MBL fold metallo-hydrolase [Aliiroseovarius sp. S1339]|uniref:MBL fold metallo-hydrolase n=1 Tax=Aliiroseovarius sp. S1339 TaxID=2936990 RepID=UPI0020BE697F|nr:MBL fold metallo-hydrolase [Aliiroseovarius sp. S1339]MCK8464811.1 MBL fold metallo-hydrolase [Aliiroseovarius sp. S1339]
MRHLTTFAALALVATAATSLAETEHNTANTISLEADHADSFLHFSPELPQMRARAAKINTDFGLHVSEIEPGLFFVTDLVYQSAFVVTDDGIVVLDAPHSFGDNLRKVIETTAPGAPITHLIMSHGHRDHNGASASFSGIPDLEIVAAAEVAQTLAMFPLDGVLNPTRTFDGALDLTVGGVDIQLQTARFHAEDIDVMIYLPDQKFLMAIDTITPGEAPFMNFGATTNVNAYFQTFDTFLAYDFAHFLSGHVSVLGNRTDVVAARDYTLDVRETVYGMMPSFNDRFTKGLTAVEFQHANLAYRYAMEGIRDDCAEQVVGRWETQLSVVDLWADSHCETTLLYAIMH